MHTSMQIINGRAVVVLRGRFDFNAHRAFRNSCNSPLASLAVRELELDLGGVEYLDSSALGMLLLLKERADEVRKPVVLSNCRGIVKEALTSASFDKIFNMA
jgi:HptB-dependent secretion and biofilm anti anti-sigma factor